MSGIRVYKHVNYAGNSAYWAHSPGWTYYRIWTNNLKNSALHDEISSLKFYSSNGERATAFLFQHSHFTGRFIAFRGEVPSHNVSRLGDFSFNDITSSILLVRHRKLEFIPLSLGSLAHDDATKAIDEALEDVSEASRRGNVVFTWAMWPNFDPDKKFVKLQVPLRIHVPNWSDYDARVTYYIYFYIDSAGRLQGYVNWVETWVDSGVISGSIIDRLHPQAIEAASTVNAEIANLVTELDFYTWQYLYYLPGVAPTIIPQDYSGHVQDDVSMILVREM